MADIIRITADEITALGDQFGSAAEETTDLLSRLESNVNSVAAGWEGDSYNAFVEKFAEIKSQMQNVVDMYNNIETMLDGVVTTMRETDAQIAGSINGNA